MPAYSERARLLTSRLSFTFPKFVVYWKMETRSLVASCRVVRFEDAGPSGPHVNLMSGTEHTVWRVLTWTGTAPASGRYAGRFPCQLPLLLAAARRLSKVARGRGGRLEKPVLALYLLSTLSLRARLLLPAPHSACSVTTDHTMEVSGAVFLAGASQGRPSRHLRSRVTSHVRTSPIIQSGAVETAARRGGAAAVASRAARRATVVCRNHQPKARF